MQLSCFVNYNNHRYLLHVNDVWLCWNRYNMERCKPWSSHGQWGVGYEKSIKKMHWEEEILYPERTCAWPRMLSNSMTPSNHRLSHHSQLERAWTCTNLNIIQSRPSHSLNRRGRAQIESEWHWSSPSSHINGNKLLLKASLKMQNIPKLVPRPTFQEQRTVPSQTLTLVQGGNLWKKKKSWSRKANRQWNAMAVCRRVLEEWSYLRN